MPRRSNSLCSKTLVSFADNNMLEFSPETFCHLGHGLRATATLLPALMELHQKLNEKLSWAVM
ncbi:hypothetical protein CWS02_18990 [Enterobacter sp. EA-1]|nr:hypothetical protein CWS02_18990 [Enterobacter sp. EA-1]